MPSTADARAFMAKRAGQLHPALDMSSTRYDALHDAYVSRKTEDNSMQQTAAQHTAHFINVMRIVSENAPSTSRVGDFDVRATHDWVEVRIEAALLSQEKYNDKTKGFKGFFPRIARKIGEMNPAIEPIATTLPAGDYTSLVCGGIVLMFKAFDRVHKVREQVISTLGEYPDLLDSVERLLRLYKDDAMLQRRATALYVALLVAIEGMIIWFEERTWKKLKAFMQQGLYAKDLEDKIAHLRQCGTELKTSADLCDKERSTEAFLVIQDIHQRLEETNRGIGNVGEQVKFHGDQNLAAIGDVRNEVLRIADQNRATIRHLEKLQDDQDIVVKNAMLSHLSDIDCAWEARAEARAQARAREAQAEVQALRAKAELLEKELESSRELSNLSQEAVQQALGSHTQDPDEVATAYTKFSRIQSSEANITNTLLRHEKFRRWYGLGLSEPLLVIPPATSAKTSPASFAAAALFHAFLETKAAITIAYFCGKDRSENTGNPAIKMLRSLIQQLLYAHEYDLTDWSAVTSLHDHHDYLFYGDMDYMCSFFKYLVRRAPSGAVFCIVDNLRVLERETAAGDVDKVLDMLTELATSEDEGDESVVFKPLLFTPLHRGRVSSSVHPDEVIRLTQSDTKDEVITPKKLSYRLKSSESAKDASEISDTVQDDSID